MTDRLSSAIIVAEIKRICREVRGGDYYVHRGMINWPKFDFRNHPRAIALTMPQVDEDGAGSIAIEATVTLEMMCKMPDFSVIKEPDDRILDEMRDDHRWIAERLAQAKLPNKAGGNGRDALILALTRLPTIEIGDSNNELQGIQGSIVLEY